MPLHPAHQSWNLTTTRLRWFSKRQQDSRHMNTDSVTEMIANLSWDTLQKRRGLVRLHMMYPIVHGLVDKPTEPNLTPSTSMTGGHDSRFHEICTSVTIYQQSFFPRTVILWNQLPLIDCCLPDNAGSLPESVWTLRSSYCI